MRSSYRNNLIQVAGCGILLITAIIFFSVMQPAFAGKESPGITGKDTDLYEGKDINKISIIAELNGVPVSTKDLLKRYNLFSLISASSLKNIKDRMSVHSYLESYFTEMLIFEEAEKMKISISRDEVEQEKKKYLEKNDISEEEFQKSLLNLKLTMEDVDRYFKNNLIVIRFGEKKFGYKEITDEEAQKYYDRNMDYFIGPEKIAVSHILICHKDSVGCLSDLTKEQAKDLAENIRKIAKPENFSDLAKQFSTDRTGADGGNLGYIARGAAVPSFEKAAFMLNKGQISDVVETEFGYHIILVTGKQKARSMTFDEAKESVKKSLKEDHIALALYDYSGQLLKRAEIKRYTRDPGQEIPAGKEPASSIKTFRTFKSTGEPANINSEGKHVILFFSSPACSHCLWVSETFDTIVKEYMEKGLIEAHHFDTTTKDDLLTPMTETEIPLKYLNIKEAREPELVPYFNFGGIYERTGTGYEDQDDFFAEEMEMRQVIDALIK